MPQAPMGLAAILDAVALVTKPPELYYLRSLLSVLVMKNFLGLCLKIRMALCSYMV